MIHWLKAPLGGIDKKEQGACEFPKCAAPESPEMFIKTCCFLNWDFSWQNWNLYFQKAPQVILIHITKIKQIKMGK